VAYGNAASHCSSTASHRTACAAEVPQKRHGRAEHGQRRDDQRDPRNGDGIGQQAHQRHLLEQQQLSGVSASVMTHCSRKNCHSRRRAPLRVSPGTAASVANSTPTATKLSQKPACINAHGSAATTTAAVSSHTCGHGQRRPVRRSSATVASIHTVRCDGTPQPLKSA
jgi:hypothetical protein